MIQHLDEIKSDSAKKLIRNEFLVFAEAFKLREQELLTDLTSCISVQEMEESDSKNLALRTANQWIMSRISQLSVDSNDTDALKYIEEVWSIVGEVGVKRP